MKIVFWVLLKLILLLFSNCSYVEQHKEHQTFLENIAKERSKFEKENPSPIYVVRDTIFDINYDHQMDYVLYYGNRSKINEQYANIYIFKKDTLQLCLSNLFASQIDTVDMLLLLKNIKKIRLDFEDNPARLYIDSDTILDMNYDKRLDYVLYYGGTPGVGVARANIYISKHDSLEWIFEGLPDCEIDIANKKIVSQYQGMGEISGELYRWEAGNWELKESFRVPNWGDTTCVMTLTKADGKEQKISTPCFFTYKECEHLKW